MSANPSDVGFHNDNLEKSTLRIIEGATWKKQRVVVIMPAAKTIATRVAYAHWSLMFPPNQAVHRMLALGCEVGDAYERAFSEIIDNPQHPCHDWEYVLCIEHDNAPPADGLVKLIKAMEAHPEYAACGGLYWTKFEGGVPQIWGDPKDPVLNYRPQPPVPNTIQECCGTGQGFTLFRMSMFKDKRLRRPWFRTLDGTEGNGISTQDLYFWGDARKCGYRCAIDTSVMVGHHDLATDIMW